MPGSFRWSMGVWIVGACMGLSAAALWAVAVERYANAVARAAASPAPLEASVVEVVPLQRSSSPTLHVRFMSPGGVQRRVDGVAVSPALHAGAGPGQRLRVAPLGDPQRGPILIIEDAAWAVQRARALRVGPLVLGLLSCLALALSAWRARRALKAQRLSAL